MVSELVDKIQRSTFEITYCYVNVIRLFPTLVEIIYYEPVKAKRS